MTRVTQILAAGRPGGRAGRAYLPDAARRRRAGRRHRVDPRTSGSLTRRRCWRRRSPPRPGDRGRPVSGSGAGPRACSRVAQGQIGQAEQPPGSNYGTAIATIPFPRGPARPPGSPVALIRLVGRGTRRARPSATAGQGIGWVDGIRGLGTAERQAAPGRLDASARRPDPLRRPPRRDRGVRRPPTAR